MQLQYGKYYINEKIAPQGYIKAETNIPKGIANISVIANILKDTFVPSNNIFINLIK